MERIEELIKMLGINRNRFAAGAGLQTSNLARMLKGELTITDKTLQKISSAYNVNMEWLKTGKGEVFYEPAPKQEDPDSSSPCFDITTIQGGAGHGTGMEQITTSMVDQAVGRMMAPGLPTGINIPYIQVRGNSMLNRKDPSQSIPDGAWVGIKASTLNAIQWGEVYAIMTTDGPIIKRVMQSDKEDCIRCVSFNEEDGFAPFDLPYTDIIPPLYNVLAVVNIKLWK